MEQLSRMKSVHQNHFGMTCANTIVNTYYFNYVFLIFCNQLKENVNISID